MKFLKTFWLHILLVLLTSTIGAAILIAFSKSYSEALVDTKPDTLYCNFGNVSFSFDVTGEWTGGCSKPDTNSSAILSFEKGTNAIYASVYDTMPESVGSGSPYKWVIGQDNESRLDDPKHSFLSLDEDNLLAKKPLNVRVFSAVYEVPQCVLDMWFRESGKVYNLTIFSGKNDCLHWKPASWNSLDGFFGKYQGLVFEVRFG